MIEVVPIARIDRRKRVGAGVGAHPTIGIDASDRHCLRQLLHVAQQNVMDFAEILVRKRQAAPLNLVGGIPQACVSLAKGAHRSALSAADILRKSDAACASVA